MWRCATPNRNIPMPTPRRWFAFRLRMLFAMVTVAAIACDWAWRNVEWVRQREQFIDALVLISRVYCAPRAPEFGRHPLLWIFGGRVAPLVSVDTAAEEVEARRLFPEALVVVNPLQPASPATVASPPAHPTP